MKRKIFWITYSIILIGLGIVFGNMHYDSLIHVFIYPFIFIGNNIKYLITTNLFTQILGLLSFLLIASLPFMYLIYRYKKKEIFLWEIILLSSLSIVSIFVLNFFVNPTMLSNYTSKLYNNSYYTITQVSVVSIYYLILFSYIGLRIANFKENISSNLISKVLLYGLMMILTTNIILKSYNSILISFINLNIEPVEVAIIVLKYIYQVSLNVAAIYTLNRLWRNYTRINDGLLSQTAITETKKINKHALIFIVSISVIAVSFTMIRLINKNDLNIKFTIPYLELTIFIISWIITKYIINNNKKINKENKS